jgi:general secretion pathway protein I
LIKQNQGFSLLEVLVAFAILGIALGVLLQIFSTGLQATKLSEEYTYATALAESKLATVGVEAPYVEGVEEGRFYGNQKYAWRTTVALYDLLEQEEGALDQMSMVPVSAYWVKVEVWWGKIGKERTVALETLRLVPE